MYAIIKTGAKQYRVAVGETVDVELIEGEIGSHVEFKEVLFLHNGSTAIVGDPFVPGCVVIGKMLPPVKADKVSSLKYIPGNHRKKIGHRQGYSSFEIIEIRSGK